MWKIKQEKGPLFHSLDPHSSGETSIESQKTVKILFNGTLLA